MLPYENRSYVPLIVELYFVHLVSTVLNPRYSGSEERTKQLFSSIKCLTTDVGAGPGGRAF